MPTPERFLDVYCPGCRKRLPYQVSRALPADLTIRYQCRHCKRLLFLRDGLIPVIGSELPRVYRRGRTD